MTIFEHIKGLEAILEKSISEARRMQQVYPDNDLRIAFMRVPSDVLDSYKLHLCAMDGTVMRGQWWDAMGAAGLTLEEKQRAINILIFLNNKSYFIFYFSRIEFLMKKSINYFRPGFVDECYKKPIKQVYEAYLQIAGLDKYISLYRVAQLLRNMIHSYNFHLSHNCKDEVVEYKERVFEFRVKEQMHWFDTNVSLFLLTELSESLIEIVNSKPIQLPEFIEDKFY